MTLCDRRGSTSKKCPSQLPVHPVSATPFNCARRARSAALYTDGEFGAFRTAGSSPSRALRNAPLRSVAPFWTTAAASAYRCDTLARDGIRAERALPVDTTSARTVAAIDEGGSDDVSFGCFRYGRPGMGNRLQGFQKAHLSLVSAGVAGSLCPPLHESARRRPRSLPPLC